ncbi:hypothetical protein ACLOJK_023685 [Asimina triloba]
MDPLVLFGRGKQGRDRCYRYLYLINMILAGRGLLSKSNLHFSTENVSTPPCACKLISRKSGESRRRRSGASKRMTLGNPAAAGADDYDRLKEVKEFDDSKIGVRGLVESGAATIPRFFHHPPENLSLNRPPAALSVPTVDLSDLETDRRSAIVRQIADASRTWGFFQITNHGIPLSVIEDAISAVRSFHEQPLAVRSKYYTRGSGSGVVYNTNVDLFQSKAASWRDTLQVLFGPEPLDAEKIPEICRRELVAWDENVRRVGENLMELLGEGLGLERGRLKEMTCSEARVAVAHYYPYCPEPDRTLGIGSHADPGVLTVLVQNEIGGLQVKHGEDWVEVKPLRGALVVNIGDLLQVTDFCLL